MCKASSEPGGPLRCSGDTRLRLERSRVDVEALLGRCNHLTAAVFRGSGPGGSAAAGLMRQYNVDAADHCPAFAATRFARAVLRPGRAVVVDTETSAMSGPICEIAVIDAHSGDVLLNTLVNARAPLHPAAQAVHGITESEMTAPGVPLWSEVYPEFQRAVGGRIMLAYNADYDRAVIADDCRRYGIDDADLATLDERWADVMQPRSDYAGSAKRLRNGGGHRALGDVQVTRQHLQVMATGTPPH